MIVERRYYPAADHISVREWLALAAIIGLVALSIGMAMWSVVRVARSVLGV